MSWQILLVSFLLIQAHATSNEANNRIQSELLRNNNRNPSQRAR
jgi:hypothetical protein